ncbi:DegQ family serine endoprotease [bacterium]|nr:DegQ family serine endoprotease [bacterium]
MRTREMRRRGLLALTILMLALSATAASAWEGELRSYADVAAKTMPAVVNISTDKMVESSFQHPFMDDPMFRRFFNMPDDEDHQNRERMEHSLGSGIVISPDGYILTNNHVIENASKIHVTFAGEREYEAEIVGSDPPTDVALIKIDAENLPFLEVADSDHLRVGDQVMAIGNPFGVGQTVTKGIVSALGRSIGLMEYSDLIQTDASINPGNSGGALVNMDGQLVGMNAAILSRSGGSQGIGFAIPTSMAMRVVESLRTVGHVQRAYLGVYPQTVDQGIADYYGLAAPRGVLVNEVSENTPAERAGLRNGDIILSVDDREITSPSMLRNVISLSEVGQKVRLAVVRDGKEQQFVVKLEELPDTGGGRNARPADPDQDESLDGVTVRELTPRLRSMSNLPDDLVGLLVTEVAPTSNAAREGLEQGDVIVEVGRVAIDSFQAFQKELGKNTDRPVFLRVFKPTQQRSVFMAVQR